MLRSRVYGYRAPVSSDPLFQNGTKIKDSVLYRNRACFICKGESNPQLNFCRTRCRVYLELLTLNFPSFGTLLGVVSSAFSILVDMDDKLSSNLTEVGLTFKCNGAYEVLDTFEFKCRCQICGLSATYVDGQCVPKKDSLTEPSIVPKFGDYQVFFTEICLVVSIDSLVLFLAFHLISTLDLHSLAVLVHQKHLGKRENKQFYYARITGHDFPSRCVACLAASLLLSYVFFVVGHRDAYAFEEYQKASIDDKGYELDTVYCTLVATATYFSFILAFHRMLILAYDTSRRAWPLTPVITTRQSKRFYTYVAFSIVSSALIISTAIAFDVIGTCGKQVSDTRQPQRSIWQVATACSSENTNSDTFWMFVRTQRPLLGKNKSSCWLKNKRGLVFFFGIPVALVSASNFIMFLVFGFFMTRTALITGPRSSYHTSCSSKVLKRKTPQIRNQLGARTISCR